MLLTTNFKTHFFNQVSFKVEVAVFAIRVDRESRLVTHRGHTLITLENGDSHFTRNDLLLGKHKHMGLVAIKEELIALFHVVNERRSDQILNNQGIRRGLNLAAMNLFGHGLLHRKRGACMPMGMLRGTALRRPVPRSMWQVWSRGPMKSVNYN